MGVQRRARTRSAGLRMCAGELLAAVLLAACGNQVGVPWQGGPTTPTPPTASLTDLNPPVIQIPSADVPWWSMDWGCRVPVRLDVLSYPDMLGGPVLVSLAAPDIDYANFQAAGEDLRVVASDAQTVLPHEIETWNPGGTSRIWVRLPDAGLPDDSLLHMYCGNGAATSTTDPVAVWAGYEGVWHLDDDLSGGVTVQGVSPQSHAGTAQGGMGAGNMIAGAVAGALEFDGTDDVVEMTADASLNSYPNGLTVTVWIYGNTFGSNFPSAVDKDYQGSWSVYIDAGHPVMNFIAGGTEYKAQGPQALQTGEWIFLAATYDNTRMRLFVNGDQVDSRTTNGSPLNTTSKPVLIGAGWEGNTMDYFHDGGLDEVEIVAAPRSPTWVAAQYQAVLGTTTSFEPLELQP